MFHVSPVSEMSEVCHVEPAGTNRSWLYCPFSVSISLVAIKIMNVLCHFSWHDICSVSAAQSNQPLGYCQIFCPMRTHRLQTLTFAWLQQDGAFLNSCGDFVTQSCCRGNMSHLRWTWVGSCLKLNCVFPTGKERQTDFTGHPLGRVVRFLKHWNITEMLVWLKKEKWIKMSCKKPVIIKYFFILLQALGVCCVCQSLPLKFINLSTQGTALCNLCVDFSSSVTS